MIYREWVIGKYPDGKYYVMTPSMGMIPYNVYANEDLAKLRIDKEIQRIADDESGVERQRIFQRERAARLYQDQRQARNPFGASHADGPLELYERAARLYRDQLQYRHTGVTTFRAGSNPYEREAVTTKPSPWAIEFERTVAEYDRRMRAERRAERIFEFCVFGALFALALLAGVLWGYVCNGAH